ncbi:hypothetical protein FJZ36_03895 [Candidatus Poribacteria bacterium]|nr:hypothetical protein [Candidatus Poribacteria bacterium]
MEHQVGDLLDGGRLRLEAALGKGGFGTVWRATELFGLDREAVPLRTVAVKCLPPVRHEADRSRIVEEARALAGLVHEAVLRLYYAFADESGAYLVTELATEGDLRDFYDGSIPSEAELREIVFSLARGLDHLHRGGFVHGDLKPENVLVTEAEEDSVRYLLADFGLRTLIGERRFQGTVPYIPPEAYRASSQPLTDRADIYAFGVLLLETATGRSVRSLLTENVLESLSETQAPPKALERVHSAMDEWLERCDWRSLRLPPFLPALLRMCLSPEPSHRPTAQGIIDLWNAFERGRRGTLMPYRFAHAPGPEARYQMQYARLLEVAETWDAERRENVAVASFVGATESAFHVRVGEKTNRSMFSSLTSLRSLDAVPMASIYGVLARDIGSQSFEADFRSYMVVRPFELVDVTHVSSSHHCSRAYLHRIVYSQGVLSLPMLRGTVLHQLFGEHLAHPETSFEELWERHWRESCLSFAFLLPTNAEYDGFRADVGKTFERIRRAVAREGMLSRPGRELESSRWSYELGLSGRVDALFTSESDRLAAYELKTGHVRPGDLLQLQAYAAILSEERRGAQGEVGADEIDAQLIVGATGRFQRPDPATGYAHLTSIRNELLRLKDALIAPRAPGEPLPEEYPYFGYQTAKCRQCRQAEPYLHGECRTTTARHGERRDLEGEPLSSLETQYYQHWTRMILREQRAMQQAYFAPLLETALREEGADATAYGIRAEHRIENAELCSVDGDVLRFRFEASVAEFSAGSDVLIHHGDIRRVSEIVRGSVVEMNRDEIVVEGNVRSRGKHLVQQIGTVWHIDPLPSLRSTDALQRALNLFIRSKNGAMKGIVLGGSIPRRQGRLFAEPTGEPKPVAAGHRLNAQQTRALVAAFDDAGFLSITGPPGTGKTATIHAIVDAFVRQGCRVLVAGFTNNAIDNVVERLIGEGSDTMIPFLRLGNPPGACERMFESIRRHGFDPRRCFAHTLGEAFTDIEALREHVESVPVFVGTAHSLLRSPWIAEETDEPLFDVVLIDEATQLTEPFAAALLTLGRKGILVGDEKQLSPIAADAPDTDAEIPEPLHALGVGGLGTSLFERLNRLLRERGDDDCLALLTQQYRMHPDIGAWASKQFYGNRLDASSTTYAGLPELGRAQDQPGWDQLRRILDPRYAFVFLDVESGGDSVPNASAAEARVAAVLARGLSQLGIESVGCITPYRNQLALLQRELADLPTFECGTVDAFQGREKSVIILSTARRDRLTDFLTNPNRLNVSVTRAKAKCILLGSARLLRGDPLLWSLIDQESCLRVSTDAELLAQELLGERSGLRRSR